MHPAHAHSSTTWAGLGPKLPFAAALGLSAIFAWFSADDQGFRFLLAAALTVLLAGLGLFAPRRMLVILVLWLVALGLLRRLATQVTPIGSADPLLLVGPVAWSMLTLAAAQRGAFRNRTALSTAVLVLGALTFVGAVNPLQGSIVAGISGLLFVFVPQLAFWVGRGLCDDRTLGLVLKLVAAVALPAALYGLYQTFGGFPSWDAQWIRESGYIALRVYSATPGEGATRPFSTFSSASEYAVFITIAILVWAGFGLTRARVPLAAGAVALLGAAVVYQSSRGIIVGLVLALGVMAAARRRLSAVLAVFVGAVLLVLLPLTVARLPVTLSNATPGAELLAHQLEGLSNPFDPQSSTLLVHLDLIRAGLERGFLDPLGLGISSVTIAGSKFGGLNVNTEADPSNVAVALGLPGLATYIVIFLLAFRGAYTLAARRRDALALVALGTLVVTTFGWLNGGQYAVAFLPWLILGWMDRRLSDPPTVEPPPATGDHVRHLR